MDVSKWKIWIKYGFDNSVQCFVAENHVHIQIDNCPLLEYIRIFLHKFVGPKFGGIELIVVNMKNEVRK